MKTILTILFVCLFAWSARAVEPEDARFIASTGADYPQLEFKTNAPQKIAGGDIYINDKKEVVINMDGQEEVTIVFDNIDRHYFSIYETERKLEDCPLLGNSATTKLIKFVFRKENK